MALYQPFNAKHFPPTTWTIFEPYSSPRIPQTNSHSFPSTPGPTMTCYTFNAFVGVTNSTWGIPCGPGPGIQTCCNSGDFCLSNDTCYTPTTKYGQGVMNLSQPYPYNWYVAGCTDPTPRHNVPICVVSCLLALLTLNFWLWQCSD